MEAARPWVPEPEGLQRLIEVFEQASAVRRDAYVQQVPCPARLAHPLARVPRLTVALALSLSPDKRRCWTSSRSMPTTPST